MGRGAGRRNRTNNRRVTKALLCQVELDQQKWTVRRELNPPIQGGGLAPQPLGHARIKSIQRNECSSEGVNGAVGRT